MTPCSDTVPLQARAAMLTKGRQRVPPLAHQLSKQHRFIAELARTTTACQSRLGWYPKGPLWLSVREARPALVDCRWYSSGDQYYRKCRVQMEELSMRAVLSRACARGLLNTLYCIQPTIRRTSRMMMVMESLRRTANGIGCCGYRGFMWPGYCTQIPTRSRPYQKSTFHPSSSTC